MSDRDNHQPHGPGRPQHEMDRPEPRFERGPRPEGGARHEQRSFGDERPDVGVRGSGAYSQGGDAWRDNANRQSGGGGDVGGGYGQQGGYGAQWGKAGYGPLSQGSSYSSEGAQWGATGYETGGGRHGPGGQGGADQRGQGYGFAGQGGGGQQWGPGRDRQGALPSGSFYGSAAQDHEHDHDPSYSRWREEQLSGHDRDYSRWRDTQARKYDEEYGKWRGERHEAFSRDFHAWRSKNGAEAAPATLTGETARSADAQVQSVADGHQGHVPHPDHHEAKDAAKKD